MNSPPKPRRAFLIFLLVAVPILLALGWSQASFNLSFIRPATAQETILLFALSALIFVAFVIFALILLRILLKLHAERKQERLGSRFKTKMVVAFLGLSLLPVCFLFVFAYGLLNRTLDKWFGTPFNVLRRDAMAVSRHIASDAEQRTLDDSSHLASAPRLPEALERSDTQLMDRILRHQCSRLDLAAAVAFDRSGRIVGRAGDASPSPADLFRLFPGLEAGRVPALGVRARAPAAGADLFLAAQPVSDGSAAPVGFVVVARRLPLNIRALARQIEQEAERYEALSREQKAVKRLDLSILGLIALLILFSATWFAMFLSKQVTIPIQALAEGTHQVSRGNLGFVVSARADGELGVLIHSFNDMTRQLQESRRALERAAQELAHSNRQLEERGNTMQAVLENIPTGVIALSSQGEITQVNSTVVRMMGREDARQARRLTDLFSQDDARDLARLIRRARRQGTVTRSMELELGGRRSTLAVTLSSIQGGEAPQAGRGGLGWVLVLEDLTDLLRAQKAAAWQEVAQRLAHEIRNPLTPIQLSAERMLRLAERPESAGALRQLAQAVTEGAALIGREVASLKELVDEFSRFARFPASHLTPANLNSIVEDALAVFDGRLDGIQVRRELAAALPAVEADREQMKRVVVNLIDNAAEAVEGSLLKEIWLRTAFDAEREVVELVVADSGPGVNRDVKEKLFLPHFSTKGRGTGLGLAIVNRIVSEHRGWIRVEDNRPSGAQFIVELPVDHPADVSGALPASG